MTTIHQQVDPGSSGPTISSISYESVDSTDYIRGSLDAPVKLVDYSDLECPFCKRHHDTLNNLIENYDEGEFAWVYRHFPLEQLHQKAIPEAVASECVAQSAGEEGFWTFIDRIYEETPSNDGLDHDLLPEFAQDAGANVEEFESCFANEETLSIVEAHLEDAQNAGGTGTPYSLLISDAEITEDARDDIYNTLTQLGPEAGSLAVFSEGGNAVGISGAIPEEPLAAIIDRLIELN
ncbi:MAG: DsbA family protein [Candidatus Campbellbacteria bacterium]|nr:DsbA family protein [Candidatus Campbellbacteria bacterium]